MRKHKLTWTYLVNMGMLLLSPINNAAPWTSTTPGGGGWYEAVGIGLDGMILAGSDLSGAYASRDNGLTWKAIGAPQGLKDTHVSGVGFHATDPKIVFLGTNHGLYRSADGALTFTKVASVGNQYITRIESAKSSPATVYAVGHSNYNTATPIIYKSIDSGITWNPVTSNLTNARIQKLIVNPSNPLELYVVSFDDRFVNPTATPSVTPPKAVFRSPNGGLTWSQLATGLGNVYDFEIAKSNPSHCYLSTDKNVYYSTTFCDSWNPSSSSQTLNTGYYFWLDPSSENQVRLIDRTMDIWNWTPNKGGVWLGTKSGNTFSWGFANSASSTTVTPTTPYMSKSGWNLPNFWHYGENTTVGPDVYGGFYVSGESLRTLAIDPRNWNHLAFVNSQWIFQSTDGGLSFNNAFTNKVSTPLNVNGTSGYTYGWKSRGFDNINTYALAASRWNKLNAANKDVIIAGYADLGCWRSLDQGASWESCNKPNGVPSPVANWLGRGGNVTTIAIDQDNKGVVWAAMGDEKTALMHLYRSNLSGRFDSWTLSDTGIPVADQKMMMGLSISPASPVGNRTLFITANGNVYRSVNGGANWAKVLSCNFCITTAVDYFNPSVVYAGGSDGLYSSEAGGAANTWSRLNSPPDIIDTNSRNSLYSNAEINAINTLTPEARALKIDSLFSNAANGQPSYFISKVEADPFTTYQAYLAVVDTRASGLCSYDETNITLPRTNLCGGVWGTAMAGAMWKKLNSTDHNNQFIKSVAASPYIKNEISVVSSVAYVTGENNPKSLGVFVKTPLGFLTQNTGLSFNNASSIVYGNADGHLLLGTLGQGVMKNW